jgi:hypothetical protein
VSTDIVTVDVPKTVVVSDNEIQVVEVAAQDEVVSVISVAEQGPAGPSSVTYIHNQASASAVWTIDHNLNRHPSTTVVDSAGNVVIGNILYASEFQSVISFSGSFAGKAYLN